MYDSAQKAQNVDKAANVYHYRQAVKLQETVAANLGTVPSSPAFAVGSDHVHLLKCSSALRKAWNYPLNLRVPPNTSPMLWSFSLHFGAGGKQWNASPAVTKQKNAPVKLFSEGKANGRVKQQSTIRSKANSADSASVFNRKTEKKVKARETPFLFSVANQDSPAPTLPVREKGKGKVMPSLIRTSHLPVLPFAKPYDEEKITGVVRSNQLRSVNVCADSEPVPTQNHGTSSVEEPRVKKESSEGKPRRNPWSADTPLRQAKIVRFCTDSDAVANDNYVTPSLEEQAKTEPKVSGIKRAKHKHGCLKDTSKKNSSLGDAYSSQFCSADVSTDSHDILAHNYVTSSAEEQIEVKPEGSRVKRTMNKESADVCGDSQVNEFQTTEEPLVTRTKRARNEEECKQPGYCNAQTCVNSIEHPSNITLGRSTRHAKREGESSSDDISITQQTEFVSRQIHHVDVQKNAEQPELMEAVDSPPEVTELPKAMEIGGEENAKIFLFGEPSEAKQPLSTSFMEELESMETDQQESGIFFKFGEAETEEMKTNQVYVFNEFSFAWENVMQLLFPRPVEEMMETDLRKVAASPCVAQLEEIMETMQEPFQMPIPVGLVGDSNLPVATEASFSLPIHEETMETQELGDTFKSVDIKLGELVESTVEMPKEETMLTNALATEEPVVQAVKEPVAQSVKEPVVQSVKEPVVQAVKEPVVQSVKEPVVQAVKEPVVQSVKEPVVQSVKEPVVQSVKEPVVQSVKEPVMQSVKEPVMQSVKDPVVQSVKEPVVQSVKEPVVQAVQEPVVQTVKEPAIAPLKERSMPPPLAKTELLQSTKPGALMYSEHLQRMEEKLSNEPGFVTIEQQQLVAVETDETKSMSQLTMEQLQVVPEHPYFPDSLDSDSDSDDSSDDEYKLDLATISEFSELHTEPGHVQLIMKLLTERELASEQ